MKTNTMGILAAILLLAGCTVGPDYEKPASSVPADWSEKGTALIRRPAA
jgi:multidrug efflux system outer membrane protein